MLRLCIALTNYHTMPHFDTTVHYMALVFHLKRTLKLSSVIRFNLNLSKILSFGNGLNLSLLLTRVICVELLPFVFVFTFFVWKRKDICPSVSSSFP